MFTMLHIKSRLLFINNKRIILQFLSTYDQFVVTYI